MENEIENYDDKDEDIPIIYSCSGASNVAQLSNYIAVEIDRRRIAEMSCIAGVGGKVKSLVKKARSGRKIIVIDGCPLHCAKHSLINVDVEPDLHYTLTDFGLKKKYHQDFYPLDAEEIIDKIIVESDLEENTIHELENKI